MTDAQIKHMVDRFLAWKLPENFSPDAGISFKAAYNEGTAHPMKHEPTGTNLFDANQAEAMVRHMLDGVMKTTKLHIIFDGPPSHVSGRFVEVETPDGKSVRAGEWHERADGMWELRLNGTFAVHAINGMTGTPVKSQ